MKEIFVCGAGGHAKVIIDIVQAAGDFEIRGIVDKVKNEGQLGFQVIDEDEFLETYRGVNVVIAIGENDLRQKVFEKFGREKYSYPNFIHPSAVVSPSVNLGVGNVVMPGAIINASTEIGDQCVMNTGSILEHDCKVGSFVSLAPASVVCGRCRLGDGVYVGANASVIHSKRIGEWSVIAAQAAVVDDVDSEVLMMGVPARLARKVRRGEKVL